MQAGGLHHLTLPFVERSTYEFQKATAQFRRQQTLGPVRPRGLGCPTRGWAGRNSPFAHALLAFQQLHNNSRQEASVYAPTVFALLLIPTPRALCTAVTCSHNPAGLIRVLFL